MKTAADIIENLTATGATLTLKTDGASFTIDAPKGLLSASDFQTLREHKTEIIAELKRREAVKTMFRLMATNAELCAEFETEVEERLSIVFENDKREFYEIETDVFIEALSRAQNETANRWLEQNRVKFAPDLKHRTA